jgi:hypothetical protein
MIANDLTLRVVLNLIDSGSGTDYNCPVENFKIIRGPAFAQAWPPGILKRWMRHDLWCGGMDNPVFDLRNVTNTFFSRRKK